MQIDRYMVNLFFEIKRNLPPEQQSNLKISDHALGDTMVNLYQTCDDENIKLLIKVFMERAGEEWLRRIAPKPGLLPNRAPSQKEKPAKRNKPKRMYRGQVVED